MKESQTEKRGAVDYVYIVQRVIAIISAISLFFPFMNPTKICALVSDNISLFTAAVSYSTLTSEAGRALRMNWVSSSAFTILYIGAIVAVVGVAFVVVGGCMSLGNTKMKRAGILWSILGGVVEIVGFVVTIVAYNIVKNTTMASKMDKVAPSFPTGAVVYIIIAAALIITSLIIFVSLPSAAPGERMEMQSQYKLFLMFLPFLALAFVFCYLPLWGWRYAFFDYQSGGTLSMSNFVGFKWFTYLFSNSATRSDIIRVMRNTFAMSGLGLITQWIPMAFAIFLCEIKNLTYRRFIQTFTTVPNFISWVLVYALAIAIFSTDGFINTFAKSIGALAENAEGKNYLMGDHLTWIKMWAWGTWKGVGWSAIIYISGIAGIDQQLYEAATVDGAGRFQKMWHITVPGLLPTFFVLLLMAVAAVLSNGLDQYLVFCTAQNKAHIEVLDLYVYNLGLGSGGSIPLSTVVGMFKSVISVVLLFGANAVSKALRGESIV
jgi:putative aldouronate transport system permease protein